MSENIQSISNGTFTIGSTSATNFEAGPGITITEPTAGTVRIGNDETVLWENALGSNWSANPTYNLSEPASNFEYLEFYFTPYTDGTRAIICQKFVQADKEYGLNGVGFFGTSGLRFEKARVKYSSTAATSLNSTDSIEWTIDKNSYTWTPCKASTFKIVGINRISGSNA